MKALTLPLLPNGPGERHRILSKAIWQRSMLRPRLRRVPLQLTDGIPKQAGAPAKQAAATPKLGALAKLAAATKPGAPAKLAGADRFKSQI